MGLWRRRNVELVRQHRFASIHDAWHVQRQPVGHWLLAEPLELHPRRLQGPGLRRRTQELGDHNLDQRRVHRKHLFQSGSGNYKIGYQSTAGGIVNPTGGCSGASITVGP